MNPERYITLVFDCDGVVLDANKLKTRAFYQAALPYGEASAQALVDYHVDHGGVSRYHKFAWLLEEVVADATGGPDLASLLERFAAILRAELMDCRIAPQLQALREQTADSRWLMVSGGDQAELREILAARGIARYFDGGIFGSPDSKDQILAREADNGNIAFPALFIGDSQYDYEAASRAGLDFVFLSQWSEFRNYKQFSREKGFPVYHNLGDLLPRKQSLKSHPGPGQRA